MAYVDTGLLENENDAPEVGGPMVPGGGASTAAPTANGPQAPTANKQKTPNNFADLSEYLRVNTPQEFGSKVAGKIGEDISKGEQTLSNAQGEFKNRADSSTVTDNNGLIDQVSTSPETVDKTAFTGLRDAQYKGPESFSDTQDLYSQATGTAGAAVGKANASKTEGGRFALLDNYFGRPNYSRGEKALDNLLIQNDDNSKQAFSQMQTNANQLQQGVATAGGELGQYGAAAKAKTQATRDAARGALTGAQQRLEGETQAQYQARVGQQSANETAIKEALASKDFSKLTPEQRQIMGTQATGLDTDSFYRVDPNQYLSKAELTQQNTATQEQQRRAAALANLSDMQNTLLPENEETGKYATDPGLGYDFNELTKAIGSGKEQYQQALAAPAKVEGTNVPGLSETTIAPTMVGVVHNAKPELYALNQKIRGGTASRPEVMSYLRDMKAAINAYGDHSLDSLYDQELLKQGQKLTELNSYWGVNGAAQTPISGTGGANVR